MLFLQVVLHFQCKVILIIAYVFSTKSGREIYVVFNSLNKIYFFYFFYLSYHSDQDNTTNETINLVHAQKLCSC